MGAAAACIAVFFGHRAPNQNLRATRGAAGMQMASRGGGKRAFNIRAASLSFALLFPNLLISRLA